MKRLSLAAIIVISAALSFFSCDKVEEDRYQVSTIEDVSVEFPAVDKGSVYRKVLLDEFTGQLCTNCPAGHAILEELHGRYGDTLVIMGIHYGQLARPFGSTFTYDFRTEAGNTIGDYFNIDGIPAAVVNREYKSGGWLRDSWQTVVANTDRSVVYAALQLINQFNASKNEIKANVKVTMLKDYPNPLQLALYVIEDGVVKPQKDGTVTIDEYTHNHVFRASFTGNAFGDYLNGGAALENGGEYLYASTMSLNDKDWNADNCSVVAVLYDKSENIVLQVESVKFK